MATNPDNVNPRSGPWTGVDESGRGGPDKLIEALNLVHRDGVTSRRPGRIRLRAISGQRINGIFEHVGTRGERRLLVMADPSYPGSTDPVAATLTEEDLTYDLLTYPVTPDPIPQGRYSAAVPFYGDLIIADPSGRLLYFDGTTLRALEAKEGLDASLGGERYLAAPPPSSLLAIWRNRLVVAGDPMAPSSIGLSEDDQSIATIPGSAQIGGPNVWPASTQFALLTDDGDVPVGITVFMDRLVVLGRSTISVVDEDAVAPAARIIQRQFGCIAAKSVVNIGTRVLYLGDRQILAFDGANAVPVSGPVHKTLERYVDWEAATSAVAVNVRRDREYRIWLPVLGDVGNRLMLAYNYEREAWRVAASWYLFDHKSRGDSTFRFDVTAACTFLIGGNQELLITGDSSGYLWLEDTGLTDHGVVFPAYGVTSALEAGAEVETFRDWFVDCLHDGSYVGGIALVDGRSAEQEIVRMLDGDLVTSPALNDLPYVVGRAIKSNQQMWLGSLGPGWPLVNIGPVYDDLKLGISARGRKVNPLLLLSGRSSDTLPLYDSSPGGVRQIEVSVRPREGRRT